MSYSNEIKEKFVELRVQGKSFDEIAKTLGVARSTLFNWQAEFEDKIKELKFIEYEYLAKEHHLLRKDILKKDIEHLKRIESALENADVTKGYYKGLFELRERLLEKVRKELGSAKVQIGGSRDLEKIIKMERGTLINVD